MQYAVPQFTDVEDKLIGPFTLRQFLTILATGGIDLFFWPLFKISLLFFIFAMPVTVLGLGLAFGKLNGRPIPAYFFSIISYVTKPQVRIFRREEPTIVINKKLEKKVEPKFTALSPQEITEKESRLRKLAYLLDQKTGEEKELIHG